LAEALALEPNFIMAYVNLNTIEDNLEHDEQAYRAMKKADEIARGPRDPDLGDFPWTIGRLTGEAAIAGYLGDYRRQIEIDREIESLPEFSGQVENARLDDIIAYALLHDPKGARAAFENLPGGNDPTGQRANRWAFAQLLFGNPGDLLAMREKLEQTVAGLGKLGPIVDTRQIRPLVAYALALRRSNKQAHALIDTTPPDCIQCLRIHGAIDGMEGNWSGAAWWYERAARAAPSLPLAWAEWGNALLNRGDADGAIAKLAIAHRKGPRYADALEWWGEALMKKNRSDLALAKFEEANRYAPNWKRLHQKWGEALSYVGRKDEAKKQFAAAAALR
jgi:tetratricopeptide (TPR) repeat protein